MSGPRTLEAPGYKLLQFLGNGARSSIWQVEDTRSGEILALKRVVRRDSGDMRFLEQALNEYNIGAQLDHPAIRGMHSFRRVRRWLSLKEIHLVMEYCHGKSVQDERPQSVTDATRIFLQVAAGLSHMNSRGFVHADIKPNNIMVAPDGAVKIIDLGQSCMMGKIKQRIQGTPDFIAPEQVYRRPIDGRTDVFNFGAALYWTLTGRPIPTVLPPKGAVTMLKEMEIVPPEQINPDVPPPLSKLIIDCIEVHPSRRPSSINAVASRLNLIEYNLNRRSNNTHTQ